MSSHFQDDLRRERLLYQHLDTLYVANGFDLARSDDRGDQHCGIDVRLTKGGHTFLVDEKAQLHYTKKPIKTFVLELSYLLRGELRQGWLHDETKQTDTYGFVSNIRLAGGATDFTITDQVVGCEVILASRQLIIERLNKACLTRDFLARVDAELRTTGDYQRTMRWPGVKVVFSSDLAEQPVNLLVSKLFLKTIGTVVVPFGAPFNPRRAA